MKIFSLLIFLVFLPVTVQAQFFNSGQDPSFIDWYQINTEHFKIVFSSNFESEASRFANLLEYAHKLSGNTMNVSTHKIPILIHNYSVESNGLTVWAPKRIEMYPVSPQDIYPQDWFEQLSLHELRHVVQLEKINQGTTKFLGYFFGQQAAGGIIGFAQSWSLEGDAVVTETSLANSGRGRVPSFSMELRSQILEQKRIFSFQKAYLGSYKDHIPDYYQLGYQITAYNRYKYGPELWSNVYNYIGEKPYTLRPMAVSIKKQTGLNKKKFYAQTFHGLDSIWKSQLKDQKFTGFTVINLRKSKDYASYIQPHVLNDSTIIALKSSINDYTRIVSINVKTGTENNLAIRGSLPDNSISVAQDFVVWSEEVPDLRWENRSYSIIRILDIKKHKSSQLTSKTRYFSPVISADTKKIATIEVSEKNINSLVILDAGTGKLLERIQSPSNQALQTPSWNEKGRNLVMTALSSKGKSILSYNLDDNTWKTILPPSSTDISQPIIAGDFIFFSSGLSGIDNIYAINTLSDSMYQITSSKFGSFNPAVGTNNRIFYSNYTFKGFDIVYTPLDSNNWTKFSNIKYIRNFITDSITRQEPLRFTYNDSNAVAYQVKKYRKFANLFNVHSWAPFYTDFNNFSLNTQPIDPGITILSQNLLGTAITTAGVGFVNRHAIYHLNTSYRGFYPILDFSANYEPNISQNIVNTIITRNILSWSANVYIPFNLSRNYHVSGIIPSINLYYLDHYEGKPGGYFRGYSTLEYNLLFYHYTIQTTRDFYPKFGQNLQLSYINSPDRDGYFSRISSFSSTLFFPGLIDHHSLKITGGMQNSMASLYYFGSILQFPRGYDNLSKVIRNSLSLNYAFPILYPDLSIVRTLYIKRIRGNFFYDYAGIYNIKAQTRNTGYLSSTGFEITSDFHLFFIPMPISVSFGLNYLPALKNWNYNVYYTVNLNYF